MIVDIFCGHPKNMKVIEADRRRLEVFQDDFPSLFSSKRKNNDICS